MEQLSPTLKYGKMLTTALIFRAQFESSGHRAGSGGCVTRHLTFVKREQKINVNMHVKDVTFHRCALGFSQSGR